MGKMLGSLILPTIHFWTRLMYWIAGILIGFLLLSSQVYVWPLADMVGQTSGLQIGLLVRSSTTLMTSIICSSRRYCSTTVTCLVKGNQVREHGRTLMGEPFALLNQLWLSGQGHEVAFDNQVGILLSEEKRRSAGARRHGPFRGSTLAFERHGRRQSGGVWHRRHTGGLLRSR